MSQKGFKVFACVVLWLLFLWLLFPWLAAFWLSTSFDKEIREIQVGNAKRQFFLHIPSGLSDKTAVPVMFFLQGFDSPEVPSFDTRWLYSFIIEMSEKKGFIAVFPRGKRGSFPEVPGVLAWYPENIFENRYFIIKLCRYIQENYNIDHEKIIWAGYSNGAYMGAIELLGCPSSPFTHFYLNAGGYPYGIKEPLPRKKVFLSVGKSDEHNFHFVQILYKFLLKHNWPESSLKISLHNGAHVYSPDSFEEMWSFFFIP
ncbi:MAG: hypothetical protein HQM10_24520 [Candidatus Riflebacteria bacterium]|nr:hypothetical protein [Candidatus Riflebacteria bacterium]